tara:strand:+ start:565 stop:1413 length:849 start_codon:yes stop_codon:yes gene_type:complete
MKKLILGLLFCTTLFSQVNRVLTLSPTAQSSAIGNVMLPMMNPARNVVNNNSLSLSRVNWMTNIVDDMNYSFINLNKGVYGLNMLFFNYGAQSESDETGVVLGSFSPMSAVYGFSYGREVEIKSRKFNLGVESKLVSHDLHTQKGLGLILGIGGYLPNVYKNLDIDVMVKNFGFSPKLGNYKTKLPTSLNVAGSYDYDKFNFYTQINFMKKHTTFGSGVTYNYKEVLWGKMGYFVDKTHNLVYPTFGTAFKYDKYFINVSYIYGNRELPLSNTIRLTLNLEL